MPEVLRIRWPDDAARVERARAAGAPRLLLVAPDADPPPVTADPLEDWERLPAREADLVAREAVLEARAARGARPAVGEDGVVRFGGRWVALSPVEARLAAALVERFGAVVGREVLVRRAWPHRAPSRNALDVHVLRLRRRLECLGLEIKTVRSRGYLLQAAPADPAVWRRLGRVSGSRQPGDANR